MNDEARQIRNELDILRDQLSRIDGPQTGVGDFAVVQTVLSPDSSYPTMATAYYRCQVCSVGGNPVAGLTGTVTPLDGRFLTAMNLGSAPIPIATSLKAHGKDGRWAVYYCGECTSGSGSSSQPASSESSESSDSG